MAKRNQYSFEKRQREILKRKKKEEKAERKRIKKAIEDGEMSPDEMPPDPDAPTVVDADSIPGLEGPETTEESSEPEAPPREDPSSGS